MIPELNRENTPETDDLPKVDTTSEEYALGFDAGTEGKPCEGETRNGVVDGRTRSNECNPPGGRPLYLEER
jgi:hypothetical protein